MKAKSFKKNGMIVRRKDGRPLTLIDDIVLVVGTFGLWTAVCLVAEAWHLYKKRPGGESRSKHG